MKKYVYMFKEADPKNKNLLGAKGAILCQLTKLKLPVPKGFIVTTEMCINFFENPASFENGFKKQTLNYLRKLENATGKTFGGYDNPLLVSVRSGARVSMPGMMDTIINIGLNDEIVEGLADRCGAEFAYNTYAHLIICFADYVKKHDRGEYAKVGEDVKDIKDLVKKYKDVYQELEGEPFPQDPAEQLFDAIKGVFKSWDNQRAKDYRRKHNIPYEWGTAVVVQEMVFGNLNKESGTGRIFSRNPITGENKVYVNYMSNAQGEDLFFFPKKVVEAEAFAKKQPAVFEQLCAIAAKLEKYYKDVQEIEFTHENGNLYILQARNRKWTPEAAIKAAYDFVQEGLCDKKHALLTLDKAKLNELLERENFVSTPELDEIVSWADEMRCLKIFANAHDSVTVKTAFALGAEGIGLCRTEAMFENNQEILKNLFKAKTAAEKKTALKKFGEFERKEFEKMFECAGENPVIIRLLDVVPEYATAKDKNPQIGRRGARLVFLDNEIALTQVEAMTKAALAAQKENQITAKLEILVPFVCDATEFRCIKDMIAEKVNALIEESGQNLTYRIGTMIETPRAAIVANEIAQYAEFISFGTNDLTQLIYGCDSQNKFLEDYFGGDIFKFNPFKTIDQNGVGKFVRIATELGKVTRPGITLGVCSEHVNDVDSIEFFHRIGLSYVSCKPDKIGLVKIAAAQASLNYPRVSGNFITRLIKRK